MMFQAVIDLNARPIMIHLGLSEENVARMNDDDPIVFNLKSLDLPPFWICLSFKHDDGWAALPYGFDGIAIALSKIAIQSMRSIPLKIETSIVHFVISVYSTEQKIEAAMRRVGLVGVDTKVKRSGFSPTDVPPCLN